MSRSANAKQPMLPRAQRNRRGEVQTGSVALVNMPFALADRPSIQCSLLKSVLEQNGRRTDVLYLNLDLAFELGHALYYAISSSRTPYLLGDWLFSVAAFGPDSREEEFRRTYPDVDLACREYGVDFSDLCDLRNKVLPSLITIWSHHIDWGQYRIVGFTSTFEQNVAALAMARAIKSRFPEVAVVMGGANLDGEMGEEHIRAFPWIDYTVSGEADVALPDLVSCIVGSKSASHIQGISGRVAGNAFANGRTHPVSDLDRLPIPNHSDYFSTLDRLGRDRILDHDSIQMPFEGARGCWWGSKHTCRFCGLNSTTHLYRSKTPSRLVTELVTLAEQYSVLDMEAVDTVIAPRHINGVFGTLAKREQYDFSIFYDVRATITRAQLRTLARGGVTSIQPGIESLSSRLLQLMRKGTNLLDNLRVLKWAQYYGMSVGWNLLTALPGENLLDYQAQADLIPLLRHLPPPKECGPIWLERFSPYFRESDDGSSRVYPRDAYQFIYGKSSADLRRISYFWDWDARGTLPDNRLTPFYAAVKDWQKAWGQSQHPFLTYRRGPTWVEILDGRSGASVQRTILRGIENDIFLFCDETYRSLTEVLSCLKGSNRKSARRILIDLCQRGFLHEDGECFITLALPDRDGQ